MSAQKKDIAQAKTLLKAGKDLDKAEDLVRKVLADTSKKYDEKHWDLLFNIIKKKYDNINERIYLKQKYDTAAVFNNALKLFEVSDAVSSLPIAEKKQNAKAKQEKRYAEALNIYRPNLYSGGLYFINKKEYQKAYQLLDTYIACSHKEIFKEYNYQENDTLLPYASYWAVYSGYKMDNPKKALKHVYSAFKAKGYHSTLLQYLADVYKMESDTARYLQTLKEGFSEYPTIPFFYVRTIDYYSELNQWKEVLSFSSKALQASPDNRWLQIAKATAQLNLEQYQECIALCDSIIQQTDTIPEFYLNAGLAYFNQGIQLDKYRNRHSQKIRQLYSEAKPYLERYRLLKPGDVNKWSLPLYTIYLNLNLGKEFDEIDQIIKQKKRSTANGKK